MKFFNIDLHVSVIEDIKTIFSSFGHEIESFSLSSHDWVFNRVPKRPEIITVNNWKNIDDEMCDQFYEYYKHKLDKYDGFIVTHTPVFSKLYEKFNKPIIVISSTRYEFPYTFDKNKWASLNHYLKNNNNIILISNNRFDKRYCELFLNKNVNLIESYCDYTRQSYTGEKEQFVIFSKKNISNFVFNNNLVFKEQLGNFSWKELYSFKGIIHLPYNISTMSIFEQYCANVPLFFPSKQLLCKLHNTEMDSLNEISYLQVGNKKYENYFNIEQDPNNWQNLSKIIDWLDLADFYNFKHISYYDNLYDINKIPFIDNLDEISKKMKIENYERKEKIYNSWKQILENIDD